MLIIINKLIIYSILLIITTSCSTSDTSFPKDVTVAGSKNHLISKSVASTDTSLRTESPSPLGKSRSRELNTYRSFLGSYKNEDYEKYQKLRVSKKDVAKSRENRRNRKNAFRSVQAARKKTAINEKKPSSRIKEIDEELIFIKEMKENANKSNSPTAAALFSYEISKLEKEKRKLTGKSSYLADLKGSYSFSPSAVKALKEVRDSAAQKTFDYIRQNNKGKGGEVSKTKITKSKETANYINLKKSGKFYTYTCIKGAKQKVYIKGGSWHTSIWSTRTPLRSFSDSRLKSSDYTITDFATKQCDY